MSRYVKSPSFFRAVYVDHMADERYPGPRPDVPKPLKTRGRYAMEFDDMLEQVRAEAKQEGLAQGWAEGWSEGLDTGRDEFDALSYDDNPYLPRTKGKP